MKGFSAARPAPIRDRYKKTRIRVKESPARLTARYGRVGVDDSPTGVGAGPDDGAGAECWRPDTIRTTNGMNLPTAEPPNIAVANHDNISRIIKIRDNRSEVAGSIGSEIGTCAGRCCAASNSLSERNDSESIEWMTFGFCPPIGNFDPVPITGSKTVPCCGNGVSSASEVCNDGSRA